MGVSHLWYNYKKYHIDIKIIMDKKKQNNIFFFINGFIRSILKYFLKIEKFYKYLSIKKKIYIYIFI